MGEKITNFLTNFQDMYISRNTTIGLFPNNITGMELLMLDKQLDGLQTSLSELSTLSKEASKEHLEEYTKLIAILNEKVDYVGEVANILLYLNSFYDMSNVVDIKNNNLRNSVSNGYLVYDTNQKGLTLRSTSSNYQCSKELNSEGTILTFYNTNLSYHSGLSLEANHLDLLSIKAITIRKVDGTIINLPVSELNVGTHYLKHDFLNSTQVSVEFGASIYQLPIEFQNYYNSLNISLIDYNYISSGDLVLQPETYTSSDYLNFIYDYNIPSDCFINNILTVDLLDINQNTLNSLQLTFPVGNPVVCRTLSRVNPQTIEEIVGIYINNKYRENKKDIAYEYLDSLPNKDEIYLVYIPTNTKVNKLNNFIRAINNQGIKINNKNIKYLNVYSTIEMFSFNPKLSPTLNTMTGVTKYE